MSTSCIAYIVDTELVINIIHSMLSEIRTVSLPVPISFSNIFLLIGKF